MNLRSLASYLMTVDPKAFDMDEYYMAGEGIWQLHSLLKDGSLIRYECGTVACAVGHGPGAGVMPTLQDGSWPNYAARVFGANSDPARGEDTLVHTWCFHGQWADIDNTPDGAAKRITYMLKHGVPSFVDDDSPKLYAHVVVPLPALEEDEAA